jgi:hypothetical protein
MVEYLPTICGPDSKLQYLQKKFLSENSSLVILNLQSVFYYVCVYSTQVEVFCPESNLETQNRNGVGRSHC